MKKIIQVTPLENYNLLLVFDDGEQRIYNMNKELTGVFEYLKNLGFSNRALTWFRPVEMEIELCPDTVYLESESIRHVIARTLNKISIR